VPQMKKPEPGAYDLPSSMNPNALIKNIPLASYRSSVKREIQFQIDQNVPGIGVYSPHEYTSIGVQKIQGGAPNNFSLLAKKASLETGGANVDRQLYVDTSSKY
jgi:hypothetical protein